jgi:hypothetical protein
MQSIGWEPVASTNRTERFLTSSEPEYDYEGDDWEEYESCPSLELVHEDEDCVCCCSTLMPF